MSRSENVQHRDTAGFAATCHPVCIACRDKADGGLGLRFSIGPDGVVTTTFDCDPCYQGYPHRLHGGITALLLDTAMTHCLFARGLQGVTARLEIRYDSPVEIGVQAFVRAYFIRETRRLHRLRAEIIQEGTARATGVGTFLPINGGDPSRVWSSHPVR